MKRGLAALALLLAALFPLSGAAQVDRTQGTSCTGTTAGPISGSTNGASVVSPAGGNNLVCISGTWQYPSYQFGSTSASCNSTSAGTIQWTGSAIEYCNGTAWGGFASNPGSGTIGGTSGVDVDLLAGSAAAPSLTFYADTATGIYQPATHTMAITTNGTERAVFDGSGNLNLVNNTGGYQIGGNNIVAFAPADTTSIAIGQGVLVNDTTANGGSWGQVNTGVGAQALYSNTTGVGNTALGDYALYSNTTGSDNAALGPLALYANTTGSFNTAIGTDSLKANTTGGNNTAVGYGVGQTTLQTGSHNILIGTDSTTDTATSSTSDAVGIGTGVKPGQTDTAVGYQALHNTTADTQYNAAFGQAALYSNTTGYQNSAVGVNALFTNTTGGYNTAIGVNALYANTTGSQNTALGQGVGQITLTTGSNNILIGTSSAVDTPLSSTSNFLNIGNTIFATSTNTGTVSAPAGAVGIGTTSPLEPLQVYGSALIASNATQTGTARNAGVHLWTDDAFGMELNYNNSSWGTAVFGRTADTVALRFGAYASNATAQNTFNSYMTILNSGNVGIANTGPGALLDIGTAGTTLGTMRLEGNTSGYVQLQSAAAAGSWTMTLPTGAGTSGYVLSTNGSGTTSWASPSFAGVIGVSRKAVMSVTAASASGTFTADQIVVGTALNGTFYNLSSYSQTVNLATTGAGGMDTGTAPVSGFVSLYAIYNPTTPATSVLACAVATSSGSVYSGSNMPAGYTASASIGIWPTNASSKFVPGLILDRHFAYQTAVNVMGATTGKSSLTSQSLSTGVPAAARTADILMRSTQSSSSLYAVVSGDGTGTGAVFNGSPLSVGTQNLGYGLTGSGAATFTSIPMITAQTVYWEDTNANVSDYLYVIGYSF